MSDIYYTLRELCIPQPKSNIKAGDGLATGKYKFFTSSNIQNKFYNKYQFDKPALIFGTGGNASIHYCDEPFSTSTDCIVLYAKDESVSLKAIYRYIEGNMHVLEYGFHGAGLKHVSKTYLLNIAIHSRVFEVQDNVVNVFDRLNILIEKRKQQLEKLELLVKSQFITMFGDIKRNDKKWNVQPLGELCTIVRGGSPRPIERYLGGNIPWIKIGDASDGESIYLHSTKEHIIPEGVSRSRMIKAGSLIFANCGVSLGFARIITFDGCIHDGWLAMENIDSRLDKVFLLQSLNQMTEHFRRIAPAGTQPNLNTAIMKSHMQIIPPLSAQKEYISFVEQTDKSKSTILYSLRKLETLKKALMQKYFGLGETL